MSIFPVPHRIPHHKKLPFPDYGINMGFIYLSRMKCLMRYTVGRSLLRKNKKGV
jgi:hypothetical protein